MSPAALRAIPLLLAGVSLHVGSGPKGKTIRRSTARELLDAGLAWETDFEHPEDRPEGETSSGPHVYMPACDRCRARFAPSVLAMDDGTGALLCMSCTGVVRAPRQPLRQLDGQVE